MSWLSNLFKSTSEQPSPSDIVPEGSLSMAAGDKLLVNIDLAKLNIPFTKPPKAWIPMIPDTNSMDPVFDYGNNNILIAGADPENQKILVDFLKVGDIAVYRIPSDPGQPALAYDVHRIVKIGQDKQGRYFRFKGDNNSSTDSYIVRDDNIQWLSIGVIY